MPSFRWLALIERSAILSYPVFCLAAHAYAQSSDASVGYASARASAADFGSIAIQSSVVANSPALETLSSEPIAGGYGSTSYSGESSRPFHRVTDYIGGHIALDLGAGVNAPIGNDIPYITWGGNFTIGGGVHLNRRFTILAEYQFMGDKLPGGLIAEAGTQGGHAHIWSFTLDPVIDLFPARANSIYVTGGGGFYRKVTSFTEPGEYQNYVVGHFSSNQGGVSFGFGVAHKLRWETNMRVFAEARYLYLDTLPSQRPTAWELLNYFR